MEGFNAFVGQTFLTRLRIFPAAPRRGHDPDQMRCDRYIVNNRGICIEP
jgi:hypothetical protein